MQQYFISVLTIFQLFSTISIIYLQIHGFWYMLLILNFCPRLFGEINPSGSVFLIFFSIIEIRNCVVDEYLKFCLKGIKLVCKGS